MSGPEGFKPRRERPKEEENKPEKSEPEMSRRTFLTLLGLGGAAAAAGVYGGIKQNEYVKEQDNIDKENTHIRKAIILEKHIQGGQGSAAEGAAVGALTGSISGPGAAVAYGIGGAITGSANSEAKYSIRFKIDGIDGKEGTQTFSISEAQYRKWNKGDTIAVKIVTDPTDSEKLRWIHLEDE